MSADLPPDVRDRAARAGHRAMNKWEPYPTDATRVLAMVDAVAEVLAAEQSVGKWREVTAEQPVEIDWKSAYESVVGAAARCQHVEAERDALNARVAELSTEHLHLSNEVEALEEWNFWLSRSLRDMARRATSFRSSYYRTARASTRYIMERSEARARVDLLTTALTDLVALCDEPHPNCHTHEECGAWQDDYRRRNTAAWARARGLVAEHTTESEA